MYRTILSGVALAAIATSAAADTPPACDEACLGRLADQFVQALSVNDGSRLPLGKTFRYTENGQALEVGDGLWGTLSAYAGQDPALAPAAAKLPYRLTLFDPSKGEVVRLVETDENTTRGLTVLRLKLDAEGKIGEAEVLPVREEFGGNRGGTVTLLQPMLLVTMDGEKLEAADPLLDRHEATPPSNAALQAAADAYLDAMQGGKGGPVPLAANCLRRDNGATTTDNAATDPLDPAKPAFKPFALSCRAQLDSGFFSNVARIRDRRYVTDTARGLVLVLTQMDLPGTKLSFKAPKVGTVNYPGPRGTDPALDGQFANRFTANMIAPVSMNAAVLFKVVEGKIARIDAFYRGAPLGIKSGW